MSVDLSCNHFFYAWQVRNRAVAAYDILIQHQIFFRKWSDAHTLEPAGTIDLVRFVLVMMVISGTSSD